MTHTMELKKNLDIYYTGDMANSSDFGKIINVYSDKWGNFVDIILNDGRKINRLSWRAFDSGPGQRFKIKSQYDKERALQFESTER